VDRQRLQTLAEASGQITRQHGAAQPRVFGSVARGKAPPESELDSLADCGPRRDLLIREAVKKPPRGFRDGRPEAPRSRIAGMQGVLLHGGLGVNLDRVLLVEQSVPQLQRHLEPWLAEAAGENWK
jgi:hypothetical protein